MAQQLKLATPTVTDIDGNPFEWSAQVPQYPVAH